MLINIYVELNLLFSSCFQERDPPTSVGAGVTHGEISLETFSGTVEDVQQGTNRLAAFNSQISSSLQLEQLVKRPNLHFSVCSQSGTSSLAGDPGGTVHLLGETSQLLIWEEKQQFWKVFSLPCLETSGDS